MPPSTKTEKPEKSARGAKPKTAAKSAKPAKEPKAAAKAAKATKPAKAAPKSKGRAAAPKGKAKPAAVVETPAQLELTGGEQGETIVEDVAPAREAAPAEGFAAVAEAEDVTVAEVGFVDEADEDEDALHDRIVAEQAELAEVIAETESAIDAEAAPVLSPEEQELAALYGDELAAAPAGAAHTEFQDGRTADEDRPMLPEINGRVERQKRWEERREARRLRRDQERQRRADRRDGGGGTPRAEGGPRPDRPYHHDRGPERRDDRRDDRRDEPREARPALVEPRPLPVATGEAPAVDTTGVVRVGNALGDAAWQVFASIKGAQPMPVRQLAGMMRKRGLIEGDPEQMWPHLKAALLGDERSYKSLGLRPRIVYRGRDLFGPGPVAQSATANAETDLARALSMMAVATHRTLKDRIAQATQAGFERLVHAYLVAAGFRDISWVKRVEGISYATALPPESSSTVLISARSGDSPVDRRGVGELRVGVEAKQLLAGYLFSARELSPEAERELERNGRSITVVAGDAFVSALLASGVGVVTAAAPVRYVDDQLLGELLAG